MHNTLYHINRIYNPQWGITFKVYFKNIAINELYQLTDGTVHVETEGAAAYIAAFEDDLDAADSLPADNDEPIDTDTNTDIPQDTISIDGVIDSVYVDTTTGDIVVVTEDGETTYTQEVNDETGEKETTLITDASGNSWTVDKEGNVTNGSGGTTNGTGNTQLALLEKLLLEILDEFDEEITQWLAVNGKGPLDATEMDWLLDLPDCLPQDEERLTYLQEVRIPAIKDNLKSFITYINEDATDEEQLNQLTRELSSSSTLKEHLTSDQWDTSKDMLCKYLIEDLYEMMSASPATARLVMEAYNKAFKEWARESAMLYMAEKVEGEEYYPSIENVSVDGVKYNDKWWAIIGANEHYSDVTFDMKDKSFRAFFFFNNSKIEGANAIFSINFEGLTGNPTSGTGYYFIFRGKHQRIVGLLKFNDKNSYNLINKYFIEYKYQLFIDMVNSKYGIEKSQDWIDYFIKEGKSLSNSFDIKNVKQVEE
ncbi:MAG: hypothetical protein L3J06_04170 [Cyclobacteriaceae bacterium]|nr:hypothetical protein [Cyclobacteriaceae bacterium]